MKIDIPWIVRVLRILIWSLPVILSWAAHISPAMAAAGSPRIFRPGFLVSGGVGPRIEQVLSGRLDKTFRPHQRDRFYFGFANQVIWIRFKIEPSPGRADDLVLSLSRPNLQSVVLFVPLGGRGGSSRYRRLHSSSEAGRSREHWGYRHPVFDIPQKFDPAGWFYLRIVSGGTMAAFSLKVFERSAFRKTSWLEVAFFALILGVLGAMFFYNLTLYFFVRDTAYIFYCFYILFMFVYTFTRSGMVTVVGLVGWDRHVLTALPLAVVFGILFTRQFLNTRKYTPVIDWFCLALVVMGVAALAANLSGYYVLANELMHVGGGMAAPVIAVVAGVIRIKQGFKPARLYLAAWGCLCLGALVLALTGFRVLKSNFITENVLFLGITAEAILLSMALGDRVRLMRLERSRMREKERRLTELSITDELTGLYNKRWFSHKLVAEVTMAREMERPLSLVVLDVDHFKQFNDTYGHAAGDKVLSGLGRTIAENVRVGDVACRYGGEEFAIILPGSALDLARSIAERVRKKFAQTVFSLDGGGSTSATISLGVTSLRASDDADALFKRADGALYQAKEQGRDRVVAG